MYDSDFEDGFYEGYQVALEEIYDGRFTCSICGEEIFPKVYVRDNGFSIVANCSEIRGDIGNKVLKEHICEKCYRKLQYYVPEPPEKPNTNYYECFNYGCGAMSEIISAYPVTHCPICGGTNISMLRWEEI